MGFRVILPDLPSVREFVRLLGLRSIDIFGVAWPFYRAACAFRFALGAHRSNSRSPYGCSKMVRE